jgi:hypothetical protein
MKFSNKIFDKMVKNDLHEIASKLVKNSAMKKDARSKGITVADKNRAKKVYERLLKGKMENNPHMSMREAYDKIKHSTLFTSKAEISRENMYKKAKEFGFNIRSKSDIEYDSSIGGFTITRGQYAGKNIIVVHKPGSYPSYEIQIV